MFGRKRNQAAETGEAVEAVETVETVETVEEAVEGAEAAVEDADPIEAADEDDDDEYDGIDAVPPEPVEVDWRADGPFDADEVELGDVQRLDLGALIVTPFEGLQLQLQVNQETKQAGAFTAIWRQSGLEVALFAASAGGGMAEEFREDVLDETAQAGGKATIEDGPFGPQVRRLLPEATDQPPAKGKGNTKAGQRIHVSWVWFAEGPRWLLRGTLLGQAAIGAADSAEAAPFVEFFRNIVVRRGGKPMVPGAPIPLDVPVSDSITEAS